MATLFDEEFEAEAIERIRKFSRIAESMGFEVAVGFSGGKDSQVVYDLCKRSAIAFKAYFNHTFEDCITLRFIRENYPDVIWRRPHNYGFFQNMRQNHNCLLPTVEYAYCCKDYKHNKKYVDDASIVGVRRAESAKSKKRKVFEAINKTFVKKNKVLFSSYFTEKCTGVGVGSKIQLKPIVDWSDDEVWEYIKRHNLPINQQYKSSKRIGCIICPKANFNGNYKSLLKYPKIVDAIIATRKHRTDCDWIIKKENKDYSDNKLEYVCRWLNHSFRPFTKKQRKLFEIVKQNYEQKKQRK